METEMLATTPPRELVDAELDSVCGGNWVDDFIATTTIGAGGVLLTASIAHVAATVVKKS